MLTRTVPRLLTSVVASSTRCCVALPVAHNLPTFFRASLLTTPTRSFHSSTCRLGKPNPDESKIKPTKIPEMFGSPAPTEARIHAIVLDLFSSKIAQKHISEVYTPTPDSGEKAVYRVDGKVPFKDLGLDSLDVVELMVAVEKAFKIEIEDKDYESVKNVDDICWTIHNNPNAFKQQ